MFVHLSRVDHWLVTKVLFVHTSVKMEVRFVTCQITSSWSSSNICNMVSVKVVLLPKSCWFNSWTSINLYGWKFKSWCKIRRTVVSDNRRACAWRTADRRGLCSTAFRTTSTFSGVLTIRADPPCFFFIAEAVVRKLCTQRSTVFRDGILPWRATLKCRRNFLCVTVTDSPFLKKCLHDECAVLRAPLLHGNWNCKNLRFQWYPSHGNWTPCLHMLAIQKTSGFTGGPCSSSTYLPDIVVL